MLIVYNALNLQCCQSLRKQHTFSSKLCIFFKFIRIKINLFNNLVPFLFGGFFVLMQKVHLLCVSVQYLKSSKLLCIQTYRMLRIFWLMLLFFLRWEILDECIGVSFRKQLLRCTIEFWSEPKKGIYALRQIVPRLGTHWELRWYKFMLNLEHLILSLCALQWITGTKQKQNEVYGPCIL